MLWPEIRRSWQDLHQTPALAWLTPDLPVRVLHSDGRETIWLGGQLAKEEKSNAVRFDAIELPESILLRRVLHVPDMGQAQIAQAVELDLRSASPFAPADMAWGYSVYSVQTGGLHIDAVLVSRKQAVQYIATQQHRLATVTAPAPAPEVWAFTPRGAPIVLAGWGEARRTQYGATRRHMAYGLLASALCLVAAMAVTPTMQLRLRAIEAVHAYDAVQARTAPLVAQREAFVRSIDELESLRGMLAERVEPMTLLEAITQTLPDDTSLQSLQVQGLKVTINGLTSNAATLMQLLGARQGFKDVRAPSAATRSPGATAENFIIEFQLDPAVFSMAGSVSSGAALPSEPALAPQTAAPAAGAVSPVTMPTPPVSPPAASAADTGGVPRPKSRFSSGPESPPPPAPGAPTAVRKAAP